MSFMQEKAQIWRQLKELNISDDLSYRTITRDDLPALRVRISDELERIKNRRAINQAILERAAQRELERAREQHRELLM